MNRKNLFVFFILMASCVGLKAQQWQEKSLKDIRPEGWLKQQLLTQKEGLSGHPEALSYPYNTCLWAGPNPSI